MGGCEREKHKRVKLKELTFKKGKISGIQYSLGILLFILFIQLQVYIMYTQHMCRLLINAFVFALRLLKTFFGTMFGISPVCWLPSNHAIRITFLYFINNCFLSSPLFYLLIPFFLQHLPKLQQFIFVNLMILRTLGCANMPGVQILVFAFFLAH